MKFLDKNSMLYSRSDVLKFGLRVLFTKYNNVNNEVEDWSYMFEKNDIVSANIKQELYGDIRSSSTDVAYLTMDNSNNEFFNTIGLDIGDANKLIGTQVQFKGDYLKEDGSFAYNGGDLLFNGYTLFGGIITNVVINESFTNVQFEIWDNSAHLRRVPVYHQNDNTVPYTAGNSGLIKDLTNIGGVIRYALKYATKAFGFNGTKRYRTSRVTAFNGATREITVVDGTDFTVDQLVKLGYDTKLSNYEENYVDTVDLTTNTVYVKYPIKNNHTSGEGVCVENLTIWKDTSSGLYTPTGMKLNANITAGTTSFVLGNTQQATFLYNLIGNNTKIKIGTYEEHFVVESVVGNVVKVRQAPLHTHVVGEYLDDSKLYIDKGHDLSLDPNQPAYMWFEKDENCWDVVVGLANSDGGKISCRGLDNEVSLFGPGFFSTSTYTTASNHCIRFDSLQNLMSARTVNQLYTDKYEDVPSVSTYYSVYNTILDDGISSRVAYDEMINYCRVNPVIRKVDDSVRTIWSLYESIRVPAGGSATFTIECNDPIDQYLIPSSMIPGTDYQMNSLPAGGGTDLTANVSFTVVTPTSAKQFDITASNSGGTDGYLILFDLQGKLYVEDRDNRHVCLAKDDASIKDNGLWKTEINNKYVNSLGYAKSLSQNIVNLFKNNYERRVIKLMLSVGLEVGDIIRIYSEKYENDFTGMIIRTTHDFSNDGFTTEIELGLVEGAEYVPGVLAPPYTDVIDEFNNTSLVDTVNTTARVDTINGRVESGLAFLSLSDDNSALQFIGDNFVDNTKIDTVNTTTTQSIDGYITASSSGSLSDDNSALQVITDDFTDTGLINTLYNTNVLVNSNLELPGRGITPITLVNPNVINCYTTSSIKSGGYSFQAGTNKYLRSGLANGNPTLNQSQLSINFWYFVPSVGASYCISKFLYQTTPSQSFSGIYLYIGGTNLYVYISNNGATSVSYLTYNNVITANNKNMITFTFDNGTYKLYVNGVLKTVTSVTGTIPTLIGTTTNPLTIGSFINNGTYITPPTLYEMDEVSIFNGKILNTTDITSLYGSGNPVDANLLTGCSYYYKFDDLITSGYVTNGEYCNYFSTFGGTETINFNTTGMLAFKINLVKVLNGQSIGIDYSINNRSTFTTGISEGILQGESSDQLLLRFRLSTTNTQNSPQINSYRLTIYR